MKLRQTIALGVAVTFLAMTSQLLSVDKKTVNLAINEAETFSFEEPVSEIFVANPEVADVQLSNSKLAYIFGKAPGRTNVFATSAKGKQLLNLNINVTQNVDQLQEILETVDPDAMVTVNATPMGVVIEGRVDDPKTAEEMRKIAQDFVGKDQSVINRLSVRAPLQVNLRVKVVEVQRQVLNALNFDWLSSFTSGNFSLGLLSGRGDFGAPTGINGTSINNTAVNTMVGSFRPDHFNINGALDSLSKEGLLTVLAEPNLVAVSGETASFLAGGEYPYPVPQDNGRITIEFKQYGVSLAFTPTVVDGSMISMRVRPEVSELDYTQTFVLAGATVPGITTRRAETSIELASGQTFAVAGLLKNIVSSNINGLPGFDSIPILGTLFRSNSFQRGDTELVFIVTPYVVQPVSGKEMALPTDGLQYATFVEQVFERKLNRKGVERGSAPAIGASGLRLIGPAGYSIE